MEHNIQTEWADVFECSCGYKYEGPNRSAVENAHLYVNNFIDDEALSESEKFFRHLNNGEVVVKSEMHMEDGCWMDDGYRITITEKGLPA